ncbi:MAG: DMT family transporter [Methanobacterium sp.]|nr:DMT family transporter [Methanobacterium sp.]
MRWKEMAMTTSAQAGRGTAPLGRHAAYERLFGFLWGLFAVFVWAGSFVLTRWGVKTALNAYDITALRFFAAGMCLAPVVWRAGLPVSRIGWPGLVILISGTGAPYALLIAIGLLFAPASHAATLVPGAMTVIVAVLGALILKERLRPLKWLGVLLILMGSLAISGVASLSVDRAGGGMGHALFLVAAFLWAGYVIVFRRSGITSLHATAIVAVGSCLAYLPIYVAFLPKNLATAPASAIVVQALYQGGLTTVVGLRAFNRAVALLGAAGGAAMASLVPVAALIIAVLFQGERPDVPDVLSVFAVCVGVLLVTIVESPVVRQTCRQDGNSKELGI